MGVFRGFFDASGKEEHGKTVVAGWLSSARKWGVFQKKWRDALRTAGVPYFHMKEFAHSTKIFTDWRGDEPRRRALLSDLIQVLFETVDHGFAAVVPHDVFRAVDRDYQLSERYKNPYVFACRDVMASCNTWLRTNKHGLNVSYVFESGDDGAGALVDLAEAERLPSPSFYPSRDLSDGQKGVIQLQAADFLAWEILKGMREPEDTAPEDRRLTIQLLSAIEQYWSVYTVRNLVGTCKAQQIPTRNQTK